MDTRLAELCERINPPSAQPWDKPLYAVMPIPGYSNFLVGKNGESQACLLLSTESQVGSHYPPIRLKNLDVQFDLHCHLKKEGQCTSEGAFTVIRCRDSDNQTTQYFLSVCETIIRILGERPTPDQIAISVNRLVAILQKVKQPATRPLNGLFGELYLLLVSGNAIRALAAWRTDGNARFDFSDGDIRLEVKAVSGRTRSHIFSYEQCNPPSSTTAIVASLYAEQVAKGTSLHSMIDEIATRVSTNADLMLKLHENVAVTLGANLHNGLSRHFDMHLAESSLRFFRLADVPAIRGPLPLGISDVHFRSDLSALSPLSIEELIDRDPTFWDLLPRFE